MILGIIVLLIGIGLTLWSQWRVKASFQRWSKVAARTGLTGREVARRILDDHGLSNVQVQPVAGQLSDHYDPTARVVRLSETVYDRASIAAISVAAHECGHAVQHQEDYGALVLRHRLVPLLNITSGISPWLLMAGILFQMSGLFLLGIIFFSIVVLFHFVTLPVEFNASSRAENILVGQGYISEDERAGVKKVLGAAAFTYVAGALVALLELLRFIAIFLMQRDRD